MPYLMVNLDDRADCRRALGQLNNWLGGEGMPSEGGPKCEPGVGRGHGPRPHGQPPLRRPEAWSNETWSQPGAGTGNPERDKLARLQVLPLPKKLERLQQRGVWKHLVAIAKLGDAAKSLPEFDQELSLPANKMRSLKANMAKLEKRFAIQFLDVNLEAGQDAAGNPRYSMPPKIRKNILRLSDM
jgi:hypothetical protein